MFEFFVFIFVVALLVFIYLLCSRIEDYKTESSKMEKKIDSLKDQLEQTKKEKMQAQKIARLNLEQKLQEIDKPNVTSSYQSTKTFQNASPVQQSHRPSLSATNQTSASTTNRAVIHNHYHEDRRSDDGDDDFLVGMAVGAALSSSRREETITYEQPTYEPSSDSFGSDSISSDD